MEKAIIKTKTEKKIIIPVIQLAIVPEGKIETRVIN